VSDHLPGESWYEPENLWSCPTWIVRSGGTEGVGAGFPVVVGPGEAPVAAPGTDPRYFAETVIDDAFDVPWIGIAPFATAAPSVGLVTVSVGTATVDGGAGDGTVMAIWTVGESWVVVGSVALTVNIIVWPGTT